jgi:hypothetical protein
MFMARELSRVLTRSSPFGEGDDPALLSAEVVDVHTLGEYHSGRDGK